MRQPFQDDTGVTYFQKSISSNFKGDLSELRKVKPQGGATTQPATKPGTPTGSGAPGGGAGNAPGANERPKP